MSFVSLHERAQNFCKRAASRYFFRDPVKIRNRTPLISFTFDDFPRSAYLSGGAILGDHGFRGTYYAALGLMNQMAPVGEIFSAEDLLRAVADGHELGCHTFNHCHAWDTPPRTFEESIVENGRRLSQLLPGVSFKSLSYPIAEPRPHNKRRVAKHFACSRAGGQTHNAGVVDRYLLAGYFIEQSRHDPDSVKRAIDKSVDACGWLIFATHDVSATPTRFGCTPNFFHQLVSYAAKSGAAVLPVGEAWKVVSRHPLD